MATTTVRKINRFTVMATLQAARARKLGLAEASAFSWGLNRAIFFAAAKRGFAGTARGSGGEEPAATHAGGDLYRLGEDAAYRDPKSTELLFTIGGETQTEADFRRQVAARFGTEQNFQRAWKEAMDTVGEYDDQTLGSSRLFYSEVYKPRRDALVAKWSEEFQGILPPKGPSRAPPRRSSQS